MSTRQKNIFFSIALVFLSFKCSSTNSNNEEFQTDNQDKIVGDQVLCNNYDSNGPTDDCVGLYGEDGIRFRSDGTYSGFRSNPFTFTKGEDITIVEETTSDAKGSWIIENNIYVLTNENSNILTISATFYEKYAEFMIAKGSSTPSKSFWGKL